MLTCFSAGLTFMVGCSSEKNAREPAVQAWGDPVALTTGRSVSFLYPAPDGQKVVMDDNFDIYMANADGTSEQALVSSSNLLEFASSVHPDGNRIVYVTIEDSIKEYTIRVYDLRSSQGETLLVSNDEVYRHTRWSPNGSRISFFRIRDGVGSLSVMNADGSGRTKLERHSDTERHPSWVADGSAIVYSRLDGENIYRIVEPAD